MGYFRLFLGLSFAAGLAVYPAQALTAARDAMANWALTVAPAIFPFIAVMPFLTSPEACDIYDRLLGSITQHVFRLPGRAASAIVTGLIAGSPAGALAVSHTAAREKLSPGQAARLAGIACGVSPGYALTVMGVSLAHSHAIGWRFVISQLAAQLITGIIFRNAFSGQDTPTELTRDTEARHPVAAAVLATLKVCGYMTLFSVGMELLVSFLGDEARILLPLIDLPTGAQYCTESGQPLWISAAALGFSGFCIIFQNMEALRQAGVRFSWLVLQKTVCSAVCCGVFLLTGMRKAPAEAVSNVNSDMCFELSIALMAFLMLPTLLFFVRKTYFLTKGRR